MDKREYLKRQAPMFPQEEMECIAKMVPLIAGAGGLGTHQALELARTGIDKMYILDYDRIQTSNLNRQVLYGRQDVGRLKTYVASATLKAMGLPVRIEALTARITSSLELPSDVTIVFDALDNIESRLVLEGLAAKRKAPLIHGAVSSWYGQVATILPGQSAGLEAIYGSTGDRQQSENSPPVFSPAVALVASYQVLEGFKVALEHEPILTNRLLVIDMLETSLEIVDLT